MNFGQMKYRVRQLLGQVDESNSAFSTANDIEPAINDATKHVAGRAEGLLTFVDYLTEEGNQRYSLKDDYLKIKAVKLFVSSNDRRTLDHLDFDEFDAIEGGNPENIGTPRGYKIEVGATDVTTNLPGDIWLVPAPDSNGGSDYTLRVYYYQKPTTLTADAEITELPEIAHPAVCYWAAMQLSMMQSDRDMYKTLLALYENEIKVVREHFGRKQRDNPSKMKDRLGISRPSRVVRTRG